MQDYLLQKDSQIACMPDQVAMRLGSSTLVDIFGRSNYSMHKMSGCACAYRPRSCTRVISTLSGDFESCEGLNGKSSPVHKLRVFLQGIPNTVLSGKSCAAACNSSLLQRQLS